MRKVGGKTKGDISHPDKITPTLASWLDTELPPATEE